MQKTEETTESCWEGINGREIAVREEKVNVSGEVQAKDQTRQTFATPLRVQNFTYSFVYCLEAVLRLPVTALSCQMRYARKYLLDIQPSKG